MKLSSTVIGPNIPSVAGTLSGPKFAKAVIEEVMANILGVKDALDRPAEYCVERSNTGASAHGDLCGVHILLNGVSRNGRESKVFHLALKALNALVQKNVFEALEPGGRCQVFVTIELDGEVETAPGSKVYSRFLESAATVIEKEKK